MMKCPTFFVSKVQNADICSSKRENRRRPTLPKSMTLNATKIDKMTSDNSDPVELALRTEASSAKSKMSRLFFVIEFLTNIVQRKQISLPPTIDISQFLSSSVPFERSLTTSMSSSSSITSKTLLIFAPRVISSLFPSSFEHSTDIHVNKILFFS
jgi:hypothetical protein